MSCPICLRPGEEEALAWPVELAEEFPFAMASWWDFIEARWLLWADLEAEYEHVPTCTSTCGRSGAEDGTSGFGGALGGGSIIFWRSRTAKKP